MSASTATSTLAGNRLLAALPRDERERLSSHREQVHLAKGKVLYEVGETVRHAYFLAGGIASLLSITEDGETVEVAMIGREGLVGIPVLLGIRNAPYRVMMQVAADAVRIRAEKLAEEFRRGGVLQNLALRYTHTLIAQISQSALCNRFHTVEQRLARWLLVASDRIQSNQIFLTQEFIAHMLGVPRTSVTMIATNLQRSGAIGYRRGKIQILDRQRMEVTSCECYKAMREEMGRFLNA